MPCTNDAQLESPGKPTTINYGKDTAVILQSDDRPRRTAGVSRDPRGDSAGAASGDPCMQYYDPRAGGVTDDSLWIERAQAALWAAQPLAQLRALLLLPQADQHPELHAKLKTMVAAAETLGKKVQASLAVRRDRGELRTLISEGEATGVALRIIARLQARILSSPRLDGARPRRRQSSCGVWSWLPRPPGRRMEGCPVSGYLVTQRAAMASSATSGPRAICGFRTFVRT